MKSNLFLSGLLIGAACLSGCATATEQVIVSFAPLNVATGDQLAVDRYTPLHLAAREGTDATVRDLLRQGENVNAASTLSGVTALILAATNGHEQIVGALLDAGAAVDGADKAGGTALMYASSKGYPGIVQMLLQHGAAVNRHSPMDELDSTALVLAAGSGQDAVLELLLKAGADMDWRTQRDGFSALMVAAELGHARSVRLLLAAGANPDFKDRKGQTACALAAANGHGAVTKVLDEFSLSQGRASRCRAASNAPVSAAQPPA